MILEVDGQRCRFLESQLVMQLMKRASVIITVGCVTSCYAIPEIPKSHI